MGEKWEFFPSSVPAIKNEQCSNKCGFQKLRLKCIELAFKGDSITTSFADMFKTSNRHWSATPWYNSTAARADKGSAQNCELSFAHSRKGVVSMTKKQQRGYTTRAKRSRKMTASNQSRGEKKKKMVTDIWFECLQSIPLTDCCGKWIGLIKYQTQKATGASPVHSTVHTSATEWLLKGEHDCGASFGNPAIMSATDLLTSLSESLFSISGDAQDYVCLRVCSVFFLWVTFSLIGR